MQSYHIGNKKITKNYSCMRNQVSSKLFLSIKTVFNNVEHSDRYQKNNHSYFIIFFS